MDRIFLDASAIFAATYSHRGGSRKLLRLSLSGKVELATSQFTFNEAEINLLKKAPEKLTTFRALIELLDIDIELEPTKDEIEAAASYTALKDAPVVAAAINSGAKYLVTFDRKHLIDPPEVSKMSGLKIMTPGEVLDELGL